MLHAEGGEKLARNKFSKGRLCHKKEGKGFLYCIACEAKVNLLKERLAETQYKCDCKISHNPSSEKCSLFAPRGNWPGRDLPLKKRVTQEDVAFLNRLPSNNHQSNWWYKKLLRRV